MKIKYLKLVNFAGIYSSLSKDKIEFKIKGKNRIILMVGPNGSGKTTILSTLHPFAYPGNMDVRNTSNLILEDKIGSKEITFEKDDDIIEVKHVYTPNSNGGHNVKSYIKVNGEEKNPNGNVRPFGDMVKLFLDVEIDFLKLTRLGTNVTGLVEMTTGDRKKFMSAILADVDIYTNFYKNVNNRAREINTLMKSLSIKLNKINISDGKLATDMKKSLEKSLNNFISNRDNLLNRYAVINHQLQEMSYDEAKEYINIGSKELLNYSKDKINLEKSYKKISANLTDYSSLDKVLEKLSTLSENLTINSTERKINLSRLDDLYSRRNEINVSIKDNEKLNDMKSIKKKMLSSIPTDIKYPVASKDILFNVFNILTDILRIHDDYNYLSPKIINIAYNLITEARNVDSFIMKQVELIDSQINAVDDEIIEIKTGDIQSDECLVLFSPTDACDNCAYKKLYHKPKKSKKSLHDLKSQKDVLQDRRENALLIKVAEGYISALIKLIKTNKNILDIITIDIEMILKDYRFEKEFDFITYNISLSENIEDVNDIKNKINELDLKIAKLEMESSISPNELIKLDKDINELNSRNALLSSNILELQTNIDILTEIISQFKKLETLNNDINASVDKINDISTKLEESRNIIQKLDDISAERNNIKIELNKINSEISNTRTSLDNLIYRISMYNECMEEADKLNSEFEEINIVREALSSNKGIPLLFMQLYLKNTTKIVNETLNNIHNNDIELQDFVVEDFRIPYTKNGLMIPDISYASQGERSLITLSLSFAIIQQSLRTYNVLLLDEIDATLDENNRRLFLPILEDKLNAFDCEQVFMISHNNTFDNQPVDIIMTSDVEIDNFKNIGNMIKI